MFLLVVFLMFFVFSFVQVGNGGGGATTDGGKPMTQAEAKKELPKVEAELAKLYAQIEAAMTSTEAGELAALRGTRVGVAVARDKARARAAGEVGSPIDITRQLSRELETGNSAVDFGTKSLNAKARAALKNPQLLLYKIQGKAYKLSFLLVPLSLPWLWLMFAWRRGIRMYYHAILALYSISFMSLLFVLGSGAITMSVTTEWFWVPLMLASFAHIYGQLKGTYALTRFSAVWRTAFLILVSLVTLSLYAALMVVIGVLD